MCPFEEGLIFSRPLAVRHASMEDFLKLRFVRFFAFSIAGRPDTGEWVLTVNEFAPFHPL
jgi:hypothetical protein